MQTPYKYELNLATVQYVIRALQAQQIKGSQQANDLLAVIKLFETPLNQSEFELATLESLKTKYPEITSKEEIVK